MSLPFRHRAGLVLAGFVVAAPLVGMGVASGATQSITFSGAPLFGLGTLACPSTPSAGNLEVPAGTTVNFINKTGRTATLWAGESQKSLPDKSLVPVTFAQGPTTVTVQMLPDCSLDLGDHGKTTVTVTASGQSAPSEAPSSASPTTTAGAPRPGETTNPPPSKSTSALAPVPSKSPGGGTATPTTSENVSAGNNDPFATPTASSAPAPVIVGSPQGPSAPRSASGLLTLIATVGVVGVSAAAVRAIFAQRAIRAFAV